MGIKFEPSTTNKEEKIPDDRQIIECQNCGYKGKTANWTE